MSFPMLLQNLFIWGNQSPTVTAITILVVLLISYRFSTQKKGAARLPPGPVPWPIVGNLLQMGELAHRYFHDVAKIYGPIVSLRLGSVPAVVISSPAMAKEVLKTQDLVFASRPDTATSKFMFYDGKDVAFTRYGPYWRQMKKLCMVELLNAKKIESLRQIREEEVSQAIRSVWEKSREGTVAVNVSQIVSSLLQSKVLRILCGTKSDDPHLDGTGNEVKEMLLEATTTAGIFNIGDFIPWLDWLDIQGVKRRMKKVHKSFDEMMSKIIEQHRERRSSSGGKQHLNSNDVIDTLLDMQAADSITITNEHIKAIVFDIFAAGVETTTATLEWAMSAMIQNPSVAKKVQEEIEGVVGRERAVKESDLQGLEYLGCVIKETLRLYPAAPLLLPHESTEAATINGYLIPKGSRIFISAWALGRDPTLWKDPLEFRPERFLGRDIDFLKGKEFFDMIPFGAGRRGCPGTTMALAMLHLTLAQLMHCFDWRVEGELNMAESLGASLPRKYDLLAFPKLRLPACP